MTAQLDRPVAPARADGFGRVLLAEWTKLRTVRGWLITLVASTGVIMLISWLVASGSFSGYDGPPIPIGPDKRPVQDQLHLVHRTLAGDGSITALVSAPVRDSDGKAGPGWAKAGIIIKRAATPGAAYTALMLTPGNGTRLQTDFFTDRAGGLDAGAPRWLRLSRTGATVTAEESTDGTGWRRVGTAPAPSTGPVEIGLFVSSATDPDVNRSLGGTAVKVGFSLVRARFESVAVQPDSTDPWRTDDFGISPRRGDDTPAGTTDQQGSTFTLTGNGSVGPYVGDADLARMALTGSLIGLIPLVTLGVLFITSEYRRDLIRTTFTAVPGRARVLAAKALVLGTAAFVAALAGCLAIFPLAVGRLRENGFEPPLQTIPSLGEPAVLRAVVGTALLLALIAVLALGVGTLLRRTASAITAVLLVLLLPTLLLSGLPLRVAEAVTTFTPVAGFAVQQTDVRYDFAPQPCLPEGGCYPLEPLPGLAVTAAWALGVLLLAAWSLRRRDA